MATREFGRRLDDGDGGDPVGAAPVGRRTLVGAAYPALARALPGDGDAPTIHDAATAAVEHRGAGQPVDAGLAAQVSAQVGADVASARVHTDPLANQASAAMGARAFAYGTDVFLGADESPADVGLMAHELTHVAQQGGGARMPAAKLEVGAADSPAEHQADQVAGAVTAGAAPTALVVDDGPTVAGQMLKSTFVAELREAVSAAADEELGPILSTMGCPIIDTYFGRYGGRPAADGEALLRRFAPEVRGARTARDMIPIVVARVRTGVRAWRDTGATPPELGEPSAAAAAPAAAGSPARMLAELGPGRALDAPVAAAAADSYGASLDHVRVHTDATAARLADAESAHAFAVGEHVVFAAGAYRPGTVEGDALIAHELAHVVQQRDAGPAAVQRKPVDGAVDGEAEAEADQATAGVLARVYGGVKGAVARLSRTPMSLRRCPKSTPSDPLLAQLHARLHASPRDVAGYWTALGAAGTTRAGDATVRAGLETFVNDGKLSWAEAFRSVAMLELGPERDWPVPVKNYAQGVDAGTFAATALPPAGADALREFCVRQAGTAADGSADARATYRAEFNARWDSARFAAFTADLDPSLDSKGPRSARSRHIFLELYALATYRTAYDTDAPAGFRQFADTYVGPDGTNLTASPRLQELRATLAPPAVVATGTGDAGYVALVGAVRPKATALDARDRQEIERSHLWRQAVDDKISGPTAAATSTLRGDLWSVVTTSLPAVAPVAPGPVTPAPVEVAPTPNAAQTAWLGGVTVAAPASPSHGQSDSHPLAFQIRSAVPNPGLGVRRRVVIEPAAQVVSGQEDETAWAPGAAASDHTAQVNPAPVGAAVNTTFTARVTLPPLSTATFPEKTATVVVDDKRLDWFRANITAGLTYMNQNSRTAIGSGSTAHYFGGQCPLRIAPALSAGTNPGLSLEMDGTLKKAGVVVETFTAAGFPSRARSASLFDTILREPAGLGAPEVMEASIRFTQGGVAVHTITVPFTLAPSPAVGGDAAQLTADNAWINQPIATAGSLLHFMNGLGGTSQRVANAVASGVLQIKACLIRSDSAAAVAALAGNPATQVAYAMGVLDPLGTATNTLVAQSGAAGWRWGMHPNTVFLNATPTIGGAHRALAQMSDLLTHEGIHAADRDGGAPGQWDRYATEFRAYWIMGVGAGQSTAFDPTMSGLGPKSPRARAIFNHVYGSPTYPFVKPAYDTNDNGFRDRADNYLFPDGINLTLSPQLADLRREVESYTGVVADYPAKRAAIVAKYALCAAPDQGEVHNNRDWRDLVESKFTTRIIVGSAPPLGERDDVKTALGIPR